MNFSYSSKAGVPDLLLVVYYLWTYYIAVDCLTLVISRLQKEAYPKGLANAIKM